MRTLLAVIDDLWEFARTSLFGVLTTKLDGGYFKDHSRSEEVEEEKTASLFAVNQHTEKKGALTIDVSSVPLMHGEQYFIGVPEAYLYTDPVVAFDTASSTHLYGTMVMVLKLGGRWAFVRVYDEEGWILKDVLREQAKDVFPSFVPEVVYDASNEETQKLRLCIDDMFLGGEVGTLLSDVEYVTFRLKRKGRSILWGTERPRIAGTWQKKLRGKPGVHMTITPKTESVMEFVTQDEGHVCYVEAVFPDESIKVSTVGLYTEGVYHESMMQKEEWRELRPVFIEVV